MKVPISWLKEYVALDLTVTELADKLTFSGIEVEGIERLGEGIEEIVVGEVVEVSPHPNADRLRLCRVSDGVEVYDVVCGAPNVVAGMKAPFARVGSTLPGGFKLKKAKIRGEVSLGMLCAEDELGISDDHDGIMELPADAAVGGSLCELLGLPDTVLELEITWNRPDCLSMIGIAREVAALTGCELKRPLVELSEEASPASESVSVLIEAPERCGRYTARVLEGLEIAPSPLWMQQRLTRAGVRPISNIVDVTNYVMLECGQPLHAFDLGKVADGGIVVRLAEAGEVLETLDGVARTLRGNDLVIADPTRALALAGVMGGGDSEIGDGTSSVLLESACFTPPPIHTTSRDLGLSSESSHRFERGVDPEGVAWASARAAQLMQQLGGGALKAGMVDVYPGAKPLDEVTLRWARLDSLMGVEIPERRTIDILESLGFCVVARDDDQCCVQVPSFRMDISREADLIEEVCRMHGLDNVPDVLPQAKVVPDADDVGVRAGFALRGVLLGLGLNEGMHYSFTSSKLLELVLGKDEGSWVVLPNPVSADHGVMRPSLIPQMVESLGRNSARHDDGCALFEMGRTFLQSGHVIAEAEKLSIGLLGKVGRRGIDVHRPVDAEEMFLWAKGIVEAVAGRCHLPVLFEPCDRAGFEPGEVVTVLLNGTPAGVLGNLSEAVRHHWRMSEPVAVAELDVSVLRAGIFGFSGLRELPSYPPVHRDVAMVLPMSVSHATVVDTIRAAAPVELTAVRLFDIFKGKGIGEGRRSLAYSLTYQSLERTLTDQEVNGFHERVREALRSTLGAEMRER